MNAGAYLIKAILIGAVMVTGVWVPIYTAVQISSGNEWRKVTEEEFEKKRSRKMYIGTILISLGSFLLLLSVFE